MSSQRMKEKRTNEEKREKRTEKREKRKEKREKRKGKERVTVRYWYS